MCAHAPKVALQASDVKATEVQETRETPSFSTVEATEVWDWIPEAREPEAQGASVAATDAQATSAATAADEQATSAAAAAAAMDAQATSAAAATDPTDATNVAAATDAQVASAATSAAAATDAQATGAATSAAAATDAQATSSATSAAAAMDTQATSAATSAAAATDEQVTSAGTAADAWRLDAPGLEMWVRRTFNPYICDISTQAMAQSLVEGNLAIPHLKVNLPVTQDFSEVNFASVLTLPRFHVPSLGKLNLWQGVQCQMEPHMQEGSWLFFDFKLKELCYREYHYGGNVVTTRAVRVGLERIEKGLKVIKASHMLRQHVALQVCLELRALNNPVVCVYVCVCVCYY